MSAPFFERVAYLLTTAGCRFTLKAYPGRGPWLQIPHQKLYIADWPKSNQLYLDKLTCDNSNRAQELANASHLMRTLAVVDQFKLIDEQMDEVAFQGNTDAEFTLPPVISSEPHNCAELLYTFTCNGYAAGLYANKLKLRLPPPCHFVPNDNKPNV